MNLLKVVIELPFEYGTKDVADAQVRATIGHYFPHDPTFSAVQKAGGKVTITVEGEPVTKNTKNTEKEGTTAPPSTDSNIPKAAPESQTTPAEKPAGIQ